MKDIPFLSALLSTSLKCKDYLLNMQRWSFLLTIFLLTFLLTNLISFFVFEHIPHIQDSICYLFQAKIFKLGRLWAESHPLKQFFDFLFMINDGRWYSQYQWGHPFLLLLGLLLNMPWIVNPILGSLAVIVIYYLGGEFYTDSVARLSAILASLSPFLLFMSSSFMSHPGTLLAVAVSSLAIIRTFKTNRLFYPLVAGLTLGFACNIRILSSFAAAFPFLAFAVYKILKTGFLKNLKGIILFFVGFLPFLVLIPLYNFLTTGDPLLFGYIVFNGEYHNYGFGTRGMAWYTLGGSVFHKLVSANPLTCFFNRNEDLVELNNYLFELPIPSLIFILILFLSKQKNKWDLLLISPLLSLSFFYYFYFFQSITYGPRFLYESLPGLCILSVRGMQAMPDFIKDLFSKDTPIQRIRTKTRMMIMISFILYLTVGIPYLFREYSVDYWEVSTELVRTLKREKIENAVVFVKFEYDDFDEEVHNILGAYHYGPLNSAFLHNSPLLDTDIVFARDMGSDNYLLKRSFPNKKYYLYRPLTNQLQPI